MGSQLFFPSPSLYLLCFASVVLVKIQPSLGNLELHQNCSRQFSCGNIKAGFPFWGGDRAFRCGHPDLQLNCENDIATMMIGNLKYRILDVDQTAQALKIARQEYFDGICPLLVSTAIDSSLFEYSAGYPMLMLSYDCQINPIFPCFLKDVNYTNGFFKTGINTVLPECNVSVNIPVSETLLSTAKFNKTALEEALAEGFKVKWKLNPCDDCSSCGYDIVAKKVICYCSNGEISNSARCSTSTAAQTPQSSPESSGKKKFPIAAGIGIAAASVAVIFLVVFFFFFIRRKMKIAALYKSKQLKTTPSNNGNTTTTSTTDSFQSIPSYPYSKSDLEKRSNYFGAQVFSFAELEEATDNFNSSKEIGDGGFGTVYLGVLRDGRVVAVKRLFENSFKRAEQFKNEIEILSRLHHPNLVKLYGCSSRHSRELLLVYEYVPNRTVSHHLHNRKSDSVLLPWPVRLSFAVETADALAYLHASDVIHRDVKTNNILVDNSFRVKVADFGLSRLFPNDVTHISTAPQGTPGYVDPEYYQCYKLTDKSDVYSFGVVLIELISGLEAVDIGRKRLDINLSNMAVNKIQNQELHELVDPSLGFDKDYAVRNMVTSVAELAFRCLQEDREIRPTMKEVLEILRGIQNEHFGAQKAEMVDICITDDVVLLKKYSPSLSPDESGTDKWVSGSTATSSSF